MELKFELNLNLAKEEEYFRLFAGWNRVRQTSNFYLLFRWQKNVDLLIAIKTEKKSFSFLSSVTFPIQLADWQIILRHLL